MPTASSQSPVSPTTRDPSSQTGPMVQRVRGCRRSVKVDGDVIRVTESHRRVAPIDAIDMTTSKYQTQLREAIEHQIAAGDGGASHLRAYVQYGPKSARCASGRNYHVTSNRRILGEQAEPKVIQRPPKEVAKPVSRPYTPKRQVRDMTSLLTPPPTPRTPRLPTPELPTLGQKQFCICAGCMHCVHPTPDQ